MSSGTLQSAFEVLNENWEGPLWMMDSGKKLLHWNEKAATLFTQKPAVGMSCSEFLEDASAKSVSEGQMRILESGKAENYSLALGTADSIYQLRQSALKGADGIEGTLCAGNSAESLQSQLQIAQKNAELYEKQLDQSQHQIKIGSWEFDIPKQEFSWSKEALRIFGFDVGHSAENLFKEHIERIHPEDRDQVMKGYMDHLEKNIPLNLKFRLLLEDGHVKHISEKCASSHSTSDDKHLCFGSIADVTKQYEYQQNLLKARIRAEESDRLKSEFLNNISHEIRTPMNGIVGVIDLLNTTVVSEEERATYRKIIQNSSERLLKIVDDLIDISTLNAAPDHELNLSRFSLHEFLKSCKEAYDERANDRGLELSIETGAGQTELMIESDRDRWNKIITHLLDNALKYTLKGSVRLGYSAHKEHFEVYVADTGIGIDEKYADSIFQNFSRGALGDTQHSGLGIGLAIVKEHVRALGGSISLDTNSEKGSTFRISIPLGNAGEVDDRSTDSTEQISALRVLIADGESDSSLIGRLAMNSSREWQSVYVADGKEAVEYCRTSSPIDLVVLSDDLPVMNGMEAAQRIKLYRPDLPLIALETKKGELNKEQAFECGFQAVLSEDSGMNEALRVIGALEAK